MVQSDQIQVECWVPMVLAVVLVVRMSLGTGGALEVVRGGLTLLWRSNFLKSHDITREISREKKPVMSIHT